MQTVWVKGRQGYSEKNTALYLYSPEHSTRQDRANAVKRRMAKTSMRAALIAAQLIKCIPAHLLVGLPVGRLTRTVLTSLHNLKSR